jgi:hypothetical protein
VPPQADTGAAIDERARRAYVQRLETLRDALGEAERRNDIGRIAPLRDEIAHLAGELARAYGGDGRPRLAGSTRERARINVRNNISNALNVLKRSDEHLWRHLVAAVRTGTFCTYRPERRVAWRF